MVLVTADLVDGDPVELFALPAEAPAGAGPVERATRRALAAAALPATSEGLGELAIAAAAAVDVAARKRDPYAIAAAGRELRETFGRLGVGAAAPTGNPDDADMFGGPEVVGP